MAQNTSVSFGPGNQGFQVGYNYGSINAEIHMPERPETPPPPFAVIPFSRDPHFVSRGDIVDQITQRCSEPGGRVALVGLGGVGKSQLAIEYAHRVAEGQPDTWVFWVYAGTQARVGEGFRTIADAIKLPGRNKPKADIPQLVLSWLSNGRNGRWTMILDSADDSNVLYGPISDDNANGRSFATYLPQSRNGSILITTRNKDLAFRLTGYHENIIEVGPMAQEEALRLLEKKLGSRPDPDVAANLVNALDYVPLAITQAAAYIRARAPRTSPSKYLADFRASEGKKSKLLEYDAGDLRRDGGSPNAILTTWQLSFEHIRSERPSAAELLSLMSFFDRQGIPAWVLHPSAISDHAMGQPREGDSGSSGSATDSDTDDDTEEDINSDFEDTDDDLDDDSDDDVDSAFEDDVAMLRNYCLIVADETGDEFEMHGLVQLSTRRWLQAFGQQGTFKQRYLELLGESFPAPSYENWATCRSLLPHVQVAFGYAPNEETLGAWAKMLYKGGFYAKLQGMYDVAQQMAEKVRKVLEKRVGKENEATIKTTGLLVTVLIDRGRWDEAEKLAVQWMEISKTKFGADHLDTLTSVATLASVYAYQGRWSDAEKLDLQVMEIRKRRLRANHPDILTTMSNLAFIYCKQGRWEDAEDLLIQQMEGLKVEVGDDHPATLMSMANLAATYRNLFRYEEAEQLAVQVMETRKANLGADHPNTLSSMNNLALTYLDQGRWEEAEKLLVQVVDMYKTKLGADHPDTINSMNNLTTAYEHQGRWEDAEKLQVQVVDMYKMNVGPDHPDTLTGIFNLALVRRSQGRHTDALDLMRDCAEARERVLGAEHLDTQLALDALAMWSG
ncbi:P-loop containing nucleoside triphosphate hydrolase protein [Chaetomium sp. MPI-CAGE-AT-0009]|nr:P-loop containing nucleoside triphosphate hydrolase protein [Chaetomium sp. MPI-CAGE-AT-0009]